MAVSACSRPAEVHYKVTVQLDEDGQIRTGSSVWVWKISRPTVALGGPYDTSFRGEAIAIPLLHHPTIYALLVDQVGDQHYGPLLAERTLGNRFAGLNTAGQPYDRVAEVKDISKRVGQRVELNCSDPGACPMLVWFEDQNDPTSVRQVDSANLPQVGFDGVVLRSVSVEVTREQLSPSIEQHLPWLRSVAKARSSLLPRERIRPGDGKPKPTLTPVQKIGTRSFSTELFK